jgi:hypothetical protein
LANHDGNQDIDHTEIPTPSTTIVSTSSIPDLTALALQTPPLHGVHLACGSAHPIVPRPPPSLLLFLDHGEKIRSGSWQEEI